MTYSANAPKTTNDNFRQVMKNLFVQLAFCGALGANSCCFGVAVFFLVDLVVGLALDLVLFDLLFGGVVIIERGLKRTKADYSAFVLSLANLALIRCR